MQVQIMIILREHLKNCYNKFNRTTYPGESNSLSVGMWNTYSRFYSHDWSHAKFSAKNYTHNDEKGLQIFWPFQSKKNTQCETTTKTCLKKTSH